jgi:hypothetical protein
MHVWEIMYGTHRKHDPAAGESLGDEEAWFIIGDNFAKSEMALHTKPCLHFNLRSAQKRGLS